MPDSRTSQPRDHSWENHDYLGAAVNPVTLTECVYYHSSPQQVASPKGPVFTFNAKGTMPWKKLQEIGAHAWIYKPYPPRLDANLVCADDIKVTFVWSVWMPRYFRPMNSGMFGFGPAWDPHKYLGCRFANGPDGDLAQVVTAPWDRSGLGWYYGLEDAQPSGGYSGYHFYAVRIDNSKRRMEFFYHDMTEPKKTKHLDKLWLPVPDKDNNIVLRLNYSREQKSKEGWQAFPELSVWDPLDPGYVNQLFLYDQLLFTAELEALVSSMSRSW
jgi:hypothetical protein